MYVSTSVYSMDVDSWGDSIMVGLKKVISKRYNKKNCVYQIHNLIKFLFMIMIKIEWGFNHIVSESGIKTNNLFGNIDIITDSIQVISYFWARL